MRLFSAQGLLCAFIVGVCLFAPWPIAEIGINDDWSYIRTAQVFAETGRFVYNGWAAAMLGWQVLWGALFAKVFCTSFICIRLSMVPLALACVLVYRAVLRRFGLNQEHATFGALCLALSPLFIPLAVTFLSDIPGLLGIFVCIYLCQHAVSAKQAKHAMLWLAAAALSNIALGTVRQIAWLGVLVIVPCCGWLLRRRGRLVVPLTVVFWLTGIVCIRLALAWFVHQPYSIPEKLLPGRISTDVIVNMLVEVIRATLTVLLLGLPVWMTGAAAIWPPRKKHLLTVVLVMGLFVLTCGVLKHLGKTYLIVPPWLGNIVGSSGIMQSQGLFGPTRRVPAGPKLLVLGILLMTMTLFVAAWRTFRSLPRLESVDAQQIVSRRAMYVLLIPFLCAYCLLLLPRAGSIALFDRYLLEVMAVLLIFSLRWHQEKVDGRVALLAKGTMAIYAAVTIAGTHDLFAMDRARVRLAEEVERSGIPRTAIRAGFEYDAITQVEAWGYYNDPRIETPPNAYRPQPTPEGPCDYTLQNFVPAVSPEYEVAADPSPCLGPGPFAPASYHTWLPLGTRWLFVGKVPKRH
jgi:hypothetical protein